MDATTTSRKVTVSCPFCGRLNRVDLARAQDRPRCGECGKPILLDRPVHVSDADFDRVIADAQVPVLVDFYADWCGPCKMMAPFLDEVARSRMGTVLVAKLDTDRSQRTTARFDIRSIPTLMVFKNGQAVDTQVGALPRARIEQMVDAALR
ncbi:MAG TPA: thioredoxin TrxC [Longimicrobium sp.]|jgi:thioredoxin 2